ncbi:MAG: beta-ketoacyl-[acyl-carrier-protein] synthase family protein [Proteobacteria bacterium]|nr:MAG: beta-ketoacyl-[acyl-carrier-protein] synthase family protein [Pseudomonadota bacterium]
MKVFITGMGALTSLGTNVDSTFEALKAGKSGVQVIEDWKQYNGLYTHLAAPVGDYNVSKLPRTVRRAMSRMSEMGALAAIEAVEQAGLGSLNSTRSMLVLGSTSGSPQTFELYFKKLFEKHGPEGQVSTSFFKVMNHSVAANVAAALDYQGPLLAPSSACSTSSQAMILGWELIKSGMYDVVVAGGADELHYMSAAIFDIVMAASRGYNDRPQEASRPFDRDRDGLVVSEGASVVVMESERHMEARKGKPLAEFNGGAYLCDSSHMSQSSTSTMIKTMHEALSRSGLKVGDIDYVNAHATATVHGDEAEIKAIADVFGAQTPVSSLKGHFGHCLAACGTLEAIAAVKMMQESLLIPTRNLENVSPDCEGVLHLKQVTERPVRHVLSNNFAFGGMNTSLLVSKV